METVRNKDQSKLQEVLNAWALEVFNERVDAAETASSLEFATATRAACWIRS